MVDFDLSVNQKLALTLFLVFFPFIVISLMAFSLVSDEDKKK